MTKLPELGGGGEGKLIQAMPERNCAFSYDIFPNVHTYILDQTTTSSSARASSSPPSSPFLIILLAEAQMDKKEKNKEEPGNLFHVSLPSLKSS